MVAAIEQGYPQREIAESSYRFQQAVETKEKLIVGVNAYVEENEPPLPILYIDESAAEAQMARLADVKRATRSGPRRAVARGAAGRRPGDRQHDVAPPRVRPRLRDGRRDVRCAPEVWGEYEEVPSI